mgnify:CR=1 FL=1
MSDKNEYKYSDFIDQIILAIEAGDEDDEMKWRADFKSNFRLSDEQINARLFKKFANSKITKKKPDKDWVTLSKVEELDYLMDGWLLKGDICLCYGASGTGKTTLALWKAYNYAKGKNILDRDTKCEKGNSLFICTDGGVSTFKNAMSSLGISDDDPLMEGDKQRIFVWGFEPEQGHEAWSCNINDVMKLEKFIETKKITYVVIDSAKSVASRGGWKYTDNDAVRVLLGYMKEGIAKPNKCHLEFISHDGTERNAAAGAKSWKEDVSMCIELTPIYEDDDQRDKEPTGVKAHFWKNRAQLVKPRRTVRYQLSEGELLLLPNEEVVGNCQQTILEILWEAQQLGTKELSRKDIATKAYSSKAKASFKTVDNTLGAMALKRLIVRPRRGKYSLSPKQLQEFESKGSPSMAGSEETKSIAVSGITQLPDSFTQVNSGSSHDYLGKKVGKLVNPSCDNQSDLFLSHDKGTLPKTLQGSGFDIGDIDGDDPHWSKRK